MAVAQEIAKELNLKMLQIALLLMCQCSGVWWKYLNNYWMDRCEREERGWKLRTGVFGVRCLDSNFAVSGQNVIPLMQNIFFSLSCTYTMYKC